MLRRLAVASRHIRLSGQVSPEALRDRASPFPEMTDPKKRVHDPTNSIMQRFAPPIAFDERFLQRAKDELTEEDRKGKTPAEIEQLEREMAIYIKQKEIQKVERGRVREDMASMRHMAAQRSKDGGQEQWFPYYIRQVRDRMEYISHNQPRRPIIENKSNALYPYKFYGEISKWNGLDETMNICRSNFTIRRSRHENYYSPLGKVYHARQMQVKRAELLRQQWTSAAALVSMAPTSVQPYLKLARYDKPIGFHLLFVPAAMSVLAGTPYGAWPDAQLLAIFGAGTLLTRGAGCTINDIFDHKLDAKVDRCKDRPIPAGLVSVDNAKIFFALQMTAAFSLLTLLNETTFLLGLCAPIPIMIYPLLKRAKLPERFRYTKLSYLLKPQLFLGMTFNWGALMGYSAVTNEINPWVQVPLYLSCVVWTVMYDTVYATQDLQEDRQLGLNTMADFSHLLPKQFRADPQKAFRSHRNRTTIMNYQQDAYLRFIRVSLLMMVATSAAFLYWLEDLGNIQGRNRLQWGFFLMAALNFWWSEAGTSFGKNSIKATSHDFFMRQKYVGYSMIGFMLIGHGVFHSIRVHDQSGQRIYPILEEFKDVTGLEVT